MKVLITGGAGYLGSTLTKHLLEAGYSVTVLDNLMYDQVTLLHLFSNPKFQFELGDVRDKKLLQELVGLNDVIIPLAAIVGMPACKANPELTVAVNYQQVADIVEVLRDDQKLILPNTNSQYGSSDTIITEESPFNPLSLYAKTKCDAENIMLANGNGVSLRLATVFGVSPRMRTDLLVNDFVYKAITDKYIVVFEKQFKRNFIHIQDVAFTFCFMIQHYDKYKSEVFNVGLSNANLSKQELLEKIQSHVKDFAVVYDDYYEDPDKRNYIVSNEKLEATGWGPQWDLNRGIKELIMAYQMIVPKMGFEFRNGFPLGYANQT